MGLTITVCDRHLKPLTDQPGPIASVRSARIVLTELDQFSPHDVVVSGDDRRAALLLNEFDVLRFEEQGIGTVALAVVHDPARTIQDSGGTVTVTPRNITDQFAQYSTQLGAVYEDTLARIVTSLGLTTPTGRTVSVYGTDGTTLIAYVQYIGNTLGVYDSNGGLAAIWPGNYVGVPLYDGKATAASPWGALRGYVTTTATGVGIAEASGTVVGTFAPVDEMPGWTATMLDDGGTVASAAPVQWVATDASKVEIDGNSLRKVALSGPALPRYDYDGTGYGTQQIAALAGGARSDASLSWQAPNVTSDYVAGLADVTGATIFNVRHGFYISHIGGGEDATDGPSRQWYVWESGTEHTSGTYRAGATFEVRISYATGVAVVSYWVNDALAYTSLVAPALPLRPLACHSVPDSDLDNAIIVRTVNATEQWYSVRWDEASPVQALLDLSAAIPGYHVRQGFDGVDGSPTRLLEFGKFGQQSGIRLVGANGGEPTAIVANPAVRLIESVDYKKETSGVFNTCTPLGNGTGDEQVNLERCWRILYDPTYTGYAKFGNVPGTIFPEFDFNYPILRGTTREGKFFYWMRDSAAYNRMGFEVKGVYNDQQFTYVDSTAANQELTARGLYMATVAQFRFVGQIHHTLSVVTVGAFRPPRAGDRVQVDFRSIGNDVLGNFAIMDTQQQAELANPYVVKVERAYNEDGTTHDTWTLSNLGFQPASQSQRGSAASLRQLSAIGIVSQGQTSYKTVSEAQDVDIQHPLTVDVYIPPECRRITRLRIAVVFDSFRQQVKTADGGIHTHTVNMPTHDHAPPAGLKAETAQIGAVPPHNHTSTVRAALGTSVPTASDNWISGTNVSGTILLVGNTQGGSISTSGALVNPSVAGTDHPHDVQGVANGAGTKKIAAPVTISPFSTDLVSAGAASEIEADVFGFAADAPNVTTSSAGNHHHDILPGLHDVSRSPSAVMEIDGGDGTFFFRTADLVDSRTKQVGPWSSDFVIEDASQFAANAVGRTVRIRLTPLVANNATTGAGLGRLKVYVDVAMQICGADSRIFTQ